MRFGARAAEHRFAASEHREHGDAGADAGQQTTGVERDQQPAWLRTRDHDRHSRQQRREKASAEREQNDRPPSPGILVDRGRRGWGGDVTPKRSVTTHGRVCVLPSHDGAAQSYRQELAGTAVARPAHDRGAHRGSCARVALAARGRGRGARLSRRTRALSIPFAPRIRGGVPALRRGF
jgi:hypothetical protein